MIGPTKTALRTMIGGLLLAGLLVSPAVGLVSARSSACNDGLDNDNDGLSDYPADPGCDSKGDKDERNASSDPAPRTFSASWVGGWGCLGPDDFWPVGTPLSGTTHAEFRLAPQDAGRKFVLTMDVASPTGDAFGTGWPAIYDAAGNLVGGGQFVEFSEDPPKVWSGLVHPRAAFLIPLECGALFSSAVLTIG